MRSDIVVRDALQIVQRFVPGTFELFTHQVDFIFLNIRRIFRNDLQILDGHILIFDAKHQNVEFTGDSICRSKVSLLIFRPIMRFRFFADPAAAALDLFSVRIQKCDSAGKNLIGPVVIADFE